MVKDTVKLFQPPLRPSAETTSTTKEHFHIDSQLGRSRQGAGFLWLRDFSRSNIFEKEKHKNNCEQKEPLADKEGLSYRLYLVALARASKPVTHSCAEMESFSLGGFGFGD